MSEGESFFRSSFASVEPPIEFDSPRLVALQGDRIAADQIYVVLQAEGTRLITQLEAAVAALTSPFPTSAHGPDRTIVVLDTNTLLHYRKPDEISWRVLTGAPEVLLVVPLVVLDELDDKRNAKDTSLARRARNIASTIEKWTATTPADTPTELADGVAIMVLSEESDHRRLSNNDDEIIAVARSLADRGEKVLVATADSGMRTRARVRGVGVLVPPDEDQLKTPDPVERDNINLRRQLHEMQVRHPALRVLSNDGRDHVTPNPPKRSKLEDPEQVVARLAADHPPLRSSSTLGGPSPGAIPLGISHQQIEQYASAREDWLARCRVAVQQRNAYREIRAGAIELSLVVRNGGQATAGDVLAELRLDDEQYWLCRPDELEAPPMPKPPPKPSPSANFDYSRQVVAQPLAPTLLQNLGGNDAWSFSKDRHVASIHVPQVRHGAVDATLPGLLLLSRDEQVARGGVTLRWRCLGAAPPVSDSGELHIVPRASGVSDS
jgi:rRNA-processing protein FCF1